VEPERVVAAGAAEDKEIKFLVVNLDKTDS